MLTLRVLLLQLAIPKEIAIVAIIGDTEHQLELRLDVHPITLR